MTKAYRDNPDRMIYDSPLIEKVTMQRLKAAYPLRGKWICESEEIHDLWHYHLCYDPKADNCLPQHEPMVIDEAKLKKTIGAEESCIIRDEKTDGIVLIVIHYFVTDPELLPWMDEIIGEATSTRRYIHVSINKNIGKFTLIFLHVVSRMMKVF